MFGGDENFNSYSDVKAEYLQRLRDLIEAHENDRMYPTCPRCEGERQINVITSIEGGRRVYEYMSCPLCGGTGSQSPETSFEWLSNILEAEYLDDEEEAEVEAARKILVS